MTQAGDPSLQFPELVQRVRAILPPGEPVYLVGGAVRDILLQRPSHDFDFSVRRDAIKLARQVADKLKAGFYPLDTERDTGRVVIIGADNTRTVLDFASFRGHDLEADLRGRDFSINAIAVDLRDLSWHDPLHGALDLRKKVIQACSPTSIDEDPVRILRGVRMAAGFGFSLQPETTAQMKAAVTRLQKVSAERLRDELFRILDGPDPAACLRVLDRLGALDLVLPELAPLKGVQQVLPHVQNVWEHTLSTLDHLTSIVAALDPDYQPGQAADWHSGLVALRIGRYRQQISQHLGELITNDRSMRSLLFLAALFHDTGKPEAKKPDESGEIHFFDHEKLSADLAIRRARGLALSNDECQRLETIVRQHMRVHFLANRLVGQGQPPSRRAVYRFFRDCGVDGVDVCLLSLADLRATYEQALPQETWSASLDVVRTLLEAWYEQPEQQVSPPALLDGNDLMQALDLQPGPLIGRLLEAIREAQAMGDVTDRASALTLARKQQEKNK